MLFDEQVGCIGTKSQLDVHIVKPRGHNVRSLLWMCLLDPLHNIARHHPLVECPFTMRHILHHNFSFSSWATGSFSGSEPLVYVRTVVYYDFAFYSVWLFSLLRNTGICLRLFCTFWLQPCHWASSHGTSYLGTGQTTTSTTDASCYCHCNNYSSGRQLQCQLMIIKLLPQLTQLGSSLHLFNMKTLSLLWASNGIAQLETTGLFFTFHALWSPEHCIPFWLCVW